MLLRRYSVIILDEAHERNINTDILIGLLSRSILLRKQMHKEEMEAWNCLSAEKRGEYASPIQPLKLVIMSATLRVDDFTQSQLFNPPPPIIKVDARQYTVSTHFSRKTELVNYLEAVYKKTCAIHKKLPPGTILVFLTGKREIMLLCRRLNSALNRKGRRQVPMVLEENPADTAQHDGLFSGMDAQEAHGEEDEDEDEVSENEEDFDSDVESVDTEDELDSGEENFEEKIDNSVKNPETTVEEDAVRSTMLREALGFVNADTISEEKDEKSDGVDDEGKKSETGEQAGPGELDATSQEANDYKGVVVLPLHAMMSEADQNKVFLPPKPGYRLIVVATNVAETSITIPGVKYVVDSGRVKEKVLDVATGISKFDVRIISKASAEQRKGRAGRTGPGHVYRLYSSAFFDQHMELFTAPEITKTPLEDLILQMKNIGINDIEKFPFPTKPPVRIMNTAIYLLLNIGALHDVNSTSKVIARADAIQNSFAFFNNPNNEVNSHSIIKSNHITELGKALVKFPIHPRLSKILWRTYATGKLQLLKHGILIVAMLSEKSPFVIQSNDSHVTATGKSDKSKQYAKSESDDESDDEVNKKNDEDGEGIDDQKLNLSLHPYGDSIARLQAIYAYLQILAIVLESAELCPPKEFDNQFLCKCFSSPKLRKWASQQPQVQLFCNDYKLHLPTLHRCFELVCQLVRLCCTMFNISMSEIFLQMMGGSEAQPLCAVSLTHLLLMAMPTDAKYSRKNTMKSKKKSKKAGASSDMELLRQCILAGFCDCIAKRAPLDLLKSSATTIVSRKKRLTGYISCNGAINEVIYMHPHSTLYEKDIILASTTLPEYVVYNDLISNQRGDMTYMTCNTIIEGHWISEHTRDSRLYHYTEPMASPPPFYCPKRDAVQCYISPSYGAHNWMLPPFEISMFQLPYYKDALSTTIEDGEAGSADIGFTTIHEPTRWFLRRLLEGDVPFQLTKELLLDLLPTSKINSATNLSDLANIVNSYVESLLAVANKVQNCFNSQYYIFSNTSSVTQLPHHKKVSILRKSCVGCFVNMYIQQFKLLTLSSYSIVMPYQVFYLSLLNIISLIDNNYCPIY